jgi:hypothetical protein
MNNKKAYFVDNETYALYELSTLNRKLLEKVHPDWIQYDFQKQPEQLEEVYLFFKQYGKLLAHGKLLNIFVGLTV